MVQVTVVIKKSIKVQARIALKSNTYHSCILVSEVPLFVIFPAKTFLWGVGGTKAQ